MMKVPTKSIWNVWYLNLTYLFIIFLFIQALIVGFNNGGGIEIVKALGERFLNITQNLQSSSLEIINSHAVFEGYGSFILTIFNLLSNFYLVYLWLRLFTYLWSLIDSSHLIISMILAVLTFLIIQIFYLFLFSAPLEGQTNIDLLKTPIYAFVDFFKAVSLLFTSIEFKEVPSSVVCNVPSGCVA